MPVRHYLCYFKRRGEFIANFLIEKLKKFTQPLAIDSEFFHLAFANPCTMLNKSAARAVCAIGNQDGAVALKVSHRIESGRNLLKISALKIHQMRPFAATISLDSTFRVMFLL
jgi:hypothetical protein